MNKGKISQDLLYTVLFTLLLVLTAVYNFFIGKGDKLFRIILVFVTVWGVYFVYKKTFFRRSKFLYYIILGFIFASMYLASVWDFYGIHNYDKALHLISGVIVALIGYVIFLNLCNGKEIKDMKPIAPVIFVIIFSIAVAGTWEMWEFLTDNLFGFNAQNGSLVDTMLDIYCGSFVGILTSIPIYLYSKGRKVKIVAHIIKEMSVSK